MIWYILVKHFFLTEIIEWHATRLSRDGLPGHLKLGPATIHNALDETREGLS